LRTAEAHRLARPDIEQRYARSEPMKRLGRPEEVGEAAAWLCSERASFVTGVPMPVDGGHMAQEPTAPACRRVVESIDINRGSIYATFGDKEGVFYRCDRPRSQDRREEPDGRIARSGSAHAIERMFDSSVQRTKAHPVSADDR
jgi:hypothetical protein